MRIIPPKNAQQKSWESSEFVSKKLLPSSNQKIPGFNSWAFIYKASMQLNTTTKYSWNNIFEYKHNLETSDHWTKHGRVLLEARSTRQYTGVFPYRVSILNLEKVWKQPCWKTWLYSLGGFNLFISFSLLNNLKLAQFLLLARHL